MFCQAPLKIKYFTINHEKQSIPLFESGTAFNAASTWTDKSQLDAADARNQTGLNFQQGFGMISIIQANATGMALISDLIWALLHRIIIFTILNMLENQFIRMNDNGWVKASSIHNNCIDIVSAVSKETSLWCALEKIRTWLKSDHLLSHLMSKSLKVSVIQSTFKLNLIKKCLYCL